MGVSKSSFYRKMKAVTGLSINEFIQNVRIKKATELLINSDMNVSEIAYETGFNDPYYFSRLFKKYHNMSPSDYRIRNSDDSVPIN